MRMRSIRPLVRSMCSSRSTTRRATTRIGDAEVLVEVTDPHGRVEKKPLLHTQAGGLRDYSELFQFGWSGEYVIRAIITLRPGAKPIEAQFTVHHTI